MSMLLLPAFNRWKPRCRQLLGFPERSKCPGTLLGTTAQVTCSKPTPATSFRAPGRPHPLGSSPPRADTRILAEAAPSAQARRPLTRYLPSGENLQSRLESLNTSEKFMAAAAPGGPPSPAAPASRNRPSATGSDGRAGSVPQPVRTPGGARHCGACSSLPRPTRATAL